MPRPTAAQLAYGSCTVIFSTLAMLLLSQASSALAVAVVAVASLALGLLVSLTVPLPKAQTAPAAAVVSGPDRQTRTPEPREPVSAGADRGNGLSADAS